MAPFEPDTPQCWRCGTSLIRQVVTITAGSSDSDAVNQWELCSWVCASALVANQIRAANDKERT